jgi:Methyltransferase domain
MLLCPMSRPQLLELLPKGGECAEIGVAKGEFSRVILDTVKPRKLHLIDPWEHQAREDYDSDGSNVDDAEHEARYKAVAHAFAADIDDGVVEIHRRYSQDAAASFRDGQLDWIYIDGLHSYDGVRSDLELYKAKVKPDGLILGHDYTNHVRAQQMKFGVVEAVNEFVLREGLAFIALTKEMFPTYVLARSASGPDAQRLTIALLYCVPELVELREFPATCAFQHKIVQVGDQVRVLPSF